MLAIQGGFEAHVRALASLDVSAVEIRDEQALEGVDALILPGGESTTIAKGLVDYRLQEPVSEFVRSGKPVMATCAGLILLDDSHLGLLDVSTERNAYGRQLASFEAPLEVDGLGSRPFEAIFIRAPKIKRVGASVEVLAGYDGDAVVVREGSMLACAFHPELTDDNRMHQMFIEMIGSNNSIELGVTG